VTDPQDRFAPVIVALILLGYGLVLLVAAITLGSIVLGVLSLCFCVGAFAACVIGLAKRWRP
jgi:hypothetical protein